MEPLFERVYTVYDYYDGPRAGFADFRGAPHAHRAIFREDLDDWDPEDRFRLYPVKQDLLALALEDWDIYRRWAAAHNAGQTPIGSQPALPADLSRHLEIAPIVARALEWTAPWSLTATATFRPHQTEGTPPLPPGLLRDLEVFWEAPRDVSAV